MNLQDESLERQKVHITDAIALQAQALELQKEHITEAMALQDERMKESLNLYEKIMSKIVTSFSETLTSTVEARMSDLAMTISDVGGQMDEFTFKLSNHVSEFMEDTKKSFDMQEERVYQMLTFQDQRMDQIMDLQGESMANIAVSFANSLEEALQGSMNTLNQEFEHLQTQMGSLNGILSTNVDQLTNMLEDQNQIMADSVKLLTNSEEMQERILLDAKEIQTRAIENTDTLNGHIENMTGVLHKLTEQNTAFTKEAFQFTKDTSEAQMRMSETVKLSQDKLEEAVNETMSQYAKMNNMISQMMDNITDRMNEAMTNAGREIAIGIKEVTADNAEAIANLTEQAQNLRSDYEDYFNRMENSTVKTIEEMDYQIRTITTRISEDIGTMMEANIKANGDILERYKDNTIDLLQSFDEQARSIGLYAKEINMDISELSSNLQSSVEEFSTKMQEGVRITLGEFDSGLSELTQRIANTVESISDAVEALPEAINKK
jgi:gas vesicle protein